MRARCELAAVLGFFHAHGGIGYGFSRIRGTTGAKSSVPRHHHDSLLPIRPLDQALGTAMWCVPKCFERAWSPPYELEPSTPDCSNGIVFTSIDTSTHCDNPARP